MRFTLFFVFQFFLAGFVVAQAPAGYYNSAQGLTGEQLQSALHNIIDGHQQQSYNSLWSHFYHTDRKSNGKVWDMYSDLPGGTPPYEFSFYSDQCGNYSGENSCYNREHSWPKSWFNEASPMQTDLFHIYPTDGYVNSRRSNYPYGEVENPTWTSLNGSKVGMNTAGWSGSMVFEPIDAYKGDLARTYFYMSVRYYGQDGSWDENEMVEGAQIKPGALDMLLQWHTADPVSQKEIDRNNAIYDIQHNRNPFIDHPEYAQNIWGTPNNPPEFTSTPVTDAYPEQTYTYNVQATDPDPNDQIEYIFPFGTNLPTWLSLTDHNDGTATLEGTPQNSLAGTQQDITLTITDGLNSQVQQNFTISIHEPTLIENPTQLFDLQIFPNPFSEKIIASFALREPQKIKIQIFDLAGNSLKIFPEKNLPVGQHQIKLQNTEEFAPGMYLLKISTQYGVSVQKIIKQPE